MNNTTLQPFKRFLWPYRTRLALLVASLLGVAAFEGLGLGLLFPLIEYVQLGEAFQSQGRSGQAMFRLLGAIGLKPSVGIFIALILSVVVVLLALKFCVNRATAAISNPLSQELRQEAFRSIMNAHIFYFYNGSSGTLINILNDEIDAATLAFNFAVIALTAAISISIYLVFILFVSWRLTLLITTIALLRYAAVSVFYRRMLRFSVQYASLKEELKSYLIGVHQGVELVKSYGATDRETEKFAGIGSRLRENADARAINTSRSQLADGLLGEGLLCLIIYAAISYFHLPGTQLLTFLAIGTRIIPKVSSFNEGRGRIAESLPCVVMLPGILSGKTLPELGWGQVHKQNFEDRIRFENVAFSYPSGKLPSLSGIDLEIRKNEIIAVVGESGSGKSTLARLLMRLFDPTAGRITVDGIALPQLRQKDWTRLVSVVSQDAFIFDDSVENNVKYGADNPSHERFEEALRRARAEAFVANLPEKEKTRLGERGIRLSGGQRQRIAIARAFLRNSPILILDEATSALDAITERQIQEALGELSIGRTVIVIAHRFTTIRDAGRIVVLDQGKIQAIGSHETLLASEPIYQRLYELQVH